MIDKIEQWIDQTLKNYSNKIVSCECFSSYFVGFYSSEFLSRCYYVVVEDIPKPDFPELRHAGLGNFIDMEIDGITYKNTYFIKKGKENNLTLHFHELVHVLQWQYLGAKVFISRYVSEIQQYGYRDAPLEKMAYTLDNHFKKRGRVFNIPNYVKQRILIA